MRIGLISCTKSKTPHPAPAWELYTPSRLFGAALGYLEPRSDVIYVLSAKYGLLPLDQEVAPYDFTLKNATPEYRRSWARQVFTDLQTRHGTSLQGITFEFHAGEAYSADLRSLLVAAGAQCSSPVEGMTIGERLHFYAVEAAGLPAAQYRVVERPTCPQPARLAPRNAIAGDGAVCSSREERPRALLGEQIGPTEPSQITGLKIHAGVWLAAALLHEAGHATFAAARLAQEVERRFGDTRPGVQTHIVAHCVANASKNTSVEYSYLFRTDWGEYRLYRLGDQLHPSRSGSRTSPGQIDVPEVYWDLWRRWR